MNEQDAQNLIGGLGKDALDQRNGNKTVVLYSGGNRKRFDSAFIGYPEQPPRQQADPKTGGDDRGANSHGGGDGRGILQAGIPRNFGQDKAWHQHPYHQLHNVGFGGVVNDANTARDEPDGDDQKD